MLLIYNLPGAACVAVIAALFYALGVLRPSAGPAEHYLVVAILTLAIGEATERLALRPRIFFLSVRAWGLLLFVFWAMKFGGPAPGALAATAIAIGWVALMRAKEAKQWRASLDALSEFRKITDASSPLRGVLLYDALFANFWKRASADVVEHNRVVLESLLRDPAVQLEIHQRDFLKRTLNQLHELQNSGATPWLFPSVWALRRQLTRLAG